MRCQRWIWLGLAGLFAATAALRADQGDAEGSQDYAGFPRLSGFVISDYSEDNPAGADFLVSRPQADDSGHVETVHVRGHRYIIRYEWSGPGILPSIYKAQLGYEKRATDAGFRIEKTGAVGNVSETFHRPSTDGHDVWVRLDPSGFYNVLTIVEASPPPPARLTTTPIAPTTLALPSVQKPAVPGPAPGVAESTPPPAPTPTPPSKPAFDPNDDSIYESLTQDGRVVVPFVFRPGRDDLADSSQPLVQQIAAMMKRHPEIFLRIEGHTDNNGDADAALRLSADRAMAVQKALVGADVDKKRLDAVGVGGLQPVGDNRTEEGRERNRRIELVLWKKMSTTHPSATGT